MSAYREDPEKRLSPQAIRDHLLAFCQQQIGKPVVLVGASLGGMLAMDFVTEFPQVCVLRVMFLGRHIALF